MDTPFCPSAPHICIGAPQVPSDAEAATFWDIQFAAFVAFVCQPSVVPFPVGVAGVEVIALSWYVINTLSPSSPFAPGSPSEPSNTINSQAMPL